MKAALTRLRPKERPEVDGHADDVDGKLPVDPDVRLQARWTGGSRLATRAATGLLWTALLAGPAGLALSVLQQGGSRPAAATPVVEDRAGEQAAVSEFAQRYVVTWLQTPRGQERQLEPYVRADNLTLPELPWVASQPGTAGIRRLTDGAWAVVVGVTVAAPRAAGATTPVRRYFQVPVSYQSGALIAVTLPAPVAGPPVGAQVPLGYRFPAAPAGPLTTAVQGFLTALLTGSGDVTRYVSPGSSIPAVLPAPYRAVTVASVMADRELPGGSAAPAGGERVRASITAVAVAGPRQQLSVQYALALTTRAGRWEVTALDPAPELASPAAAATPGATSSVAPFSGAAGVSRPAGTPRPAGISRVGEQPAIN